AQGGDAAHAIGAEVEIDEIDPAILHGTHFNPPIIGHIQRDNDVAAPIDRFADLPVSQSERTLREKIGRLIAEAEAKIEAALGGGRCTERRTYCQSRYRNQYRLHVILPAPLSQPRQMRLNVC